MVKNSTDAMKDYWALDYANMVMLFQNHKFVTTDFLHLINVFPKKICNDKNGG